MYTNIQIDCRSDIPEDITALRDAVFRRDYPCINKELDRFPEPLSVQAASQLLVDALEHGLKAEGFEAILAHCSSEDGQMSLAGVHRAAFKDRDDVLALLLERGAGPDRNAGFGSSLLESALMGGALKSVKFLLRQPWLKIRWTDTLLSLWARADDNHRLLADDNHRLLKECIQAIASRFTGWEALSGEPLPIPRRMTALIIARTGNWPMLERFCRERGGVSANGRMEILHRLCSVATGRLVKADEDVCASALAAFLESCPLPKLLKNQVECRPLLRCFLRFGEGNRERLRPFVESLSGRWISMDYDDWRYFGLDRLPDLWHALLPNGPTLVLERWHDEIGFLCNREQYEQSRTSEILRHILDMCPVRGKGGGKLSPLGRTLLRCADAAMLEDFFRPDGGLLATEAPDSMMDELREFSWGLYLGRGYSTAGAAMAALLQSRPELLENERHCWTLLHSFLTADEADRGRLLPFVESLAPRRVAIDLEEWLRVAHAVLPDGWRELLPRGLELVIDRWENIFYLNPDCSWVTNVASTRAVESVKILGRLLAVCPIRGEGRKGELSPAARAVLRSGDAAMIEALFQKSDGLLATEDPDALIAYAMREDLPRANRAAALAFVRKRVDYDL